jgi:hypothetical protein
MGGKVGFMGLVNYKDHPTDNRYTIFNFNSVDEANCFEKMLVNEGVKFEKDEELMADNTLLSYTQTPSQREKTLTYLFAVSQRDFKRAQHANFLVSAKFRDPVFKKSYIKWGLIIFFLGIVGFSITGYFMAG